MKSEISSIKLFQALWKKQAWVQAVTLLAAFLSGPLVMLMSINQWEKAGETTRAMQLRFLACIDGSRYQDTSTRMEIYIVCMMAAGVIAAWYLFSYLHAREKTDFYHALPVSRGRLFLLHTLCAVMNYTVAGLTAMLLMLLAGVAKGITTAPSIRAAAALWVTGFVFYLLCFALAALAMLLTGRILVGILGTIIFFTIGPMIHMIGSYYASCFFDTWYEGFGRSSVLGISNPIIPALRAAAGLYDGSGWRWAGAAAVVAAAVLILDALLCRKRPSEAAGKAMAFYHVGEGIQILLSIVAALMCGLFSLVTMGPEENGWFLFALLFGLAVFYAVIRMIYYTNLKKVFAGKVQLLLALGLTLATAAFYKFDLSGYDSCLPAQEKIASVGMSLDEDILNYYGGLLMDERMNNMQLECDDDVYALLRAFVDHRIPGRTQTADRLEYRKDVVFRLKSGKKIYRSYCVDFSDVCGQVKKLYEKPEYISWLYLMDRTDASKVTDVSFSLMDTTSEDMLFSDYVSLSGKDGEELVRALQEESSHIRSDTLVSETPIASVTCVMRLKDLQEDLHMQLEENGDLPDSRYGYGVLVYPSFRRTCELLRRFAKESGQSFRGSDVRRITLFLPEDGNAAEVEQIRQRYDAKETAEEDNGHALVVERPEIIRKMLPDILFNPTRTIWQDYALLQDGKRISVGVQGPASDPESGFWLSGTLKLAS